ncbi:DMT family transporter [Deferrisoma sp.]
MNAADRPGRLPLGPVLILLGLSLLWGGNMAAIKIAARDVAPVFQAGVRSAVAAGCLWVWMRVVGLPVFPSRAALGHGVVVGALFGLEFGAIYLGLNYTFASRAYVFLYTQPFFTALGAHFWLGNDPMDRRKALGLVLAFAGVVVLFGKDWGEVTLRTLPGDLLLLSAGALWAATTLYIKRYLTAVAVPLQTLFYQVGFSAPLLFLLSALLEPAPVRGASPAGFLALAYQCVVVAFLSYLVWFELVQRYPVSLLAGFTFFTPVFGVLVSGVWILREPITAAVFVALALVSAGMVLVNRPRRAADLPVPE